MGDGNLSVSGPNGKPRLRIGRSLSDKRYNLWIKREFKKYCTKKAICDFKGFDWRYKKFYYKSFLSTMRHIDFKTTYERWYKSKKGIPKDLILTPLVMAIWFADDGCLYKKSKNGISAGYELSFATASFGKKGSIFLAKKLNLTYGGGFRVYGGYGAEGSRHYKIMASTIPARKLLRDINRCFPDLKRKSDIWRKPSFKLSLMPKMCKYCKSEKTLKNGFYKGRGTIRLAQRFKCNTCHRWWKENLI